MKNRLITVSIVIFCVYFADGQTQNKTVAKTAKKESQLLIKQGWNIDGEIAIEDALYTHLLTIDESDNSEIIGLVEAEAHCTELNRAKQWATLNAASAYAKRAGMSVRGFIVSEMGTNRDGDYENFCERYEASLKREIKNMLKLSFGIYRVVDGGNIEYRAYFLLDEKHASQTRVEAARKAVSQTEQMRGQLDEITNFLAEPVK